MKHIILLLLFSFVATLLVAQAIVPPPPPPPPPPFTVPDSIKSSGDQSFKTEEVDGKTIYVVAEKMPEYPGGLNEMMDFLAGHIKYPDEARKKGIQGTVYLKFIVTTEGDVGNVTVLRGIGYGCDEAAIRAVKKMPRWKPGSLNGQNIDVFFTLPVKFSLNN